MTLEETRSITILNKKLLYKGKKDKTKQENKIYTNPIQ